jgi:hypothetical protein
MSDSPFKKTGEKRPPRRGEWYKKPSGGVRRAKFDFRHRELEIVTLEGE